MTNYHRLGKSSYPLVLIGVVVALMIALGALVGVMMGGANVAKLKAEKEKVDNRILRAERLMQGTQNDVALRASETYLGVIGKIGAENNFHKEMKDAKYPLGHRKLILAELNKKDASLDDAKQMIEDFHVQGLNARQYRQEQLQKFYTAFVTGGESTPDMKSIAEEYKKRIPAEVMMVMQGDFDFGTGAKALYEAQKGVNGNQKSINRDLAKKLEQAQGEVKINFENRNRSIASVKKTFFEKFEKLEQLRHEKFEAQNKSWDGYLMQTRDALSERRVNSTRILSLESELRELEKLLRKRRIAGQDWIPPIDLVDGTVLEADSKLQIAVIDIGRSHGLRTGQHFDVFRMKGDVRQETKARLVVTNMQDKIATCKILDYDDMNPVVAGDRIADNGTTDAPFDRKIQLKYCLRGSFLDPSLDLVRFMILQSGGEIVDQISKRVDYLVLGEDARKSEVDTSTRLGIKVIRAPDLDEHLGLSGAEVARMDRRIWKREE